MEVCVDCGDPSVRAGRCAECLEEVAESPNWGSAPATPLVRPERLTAESVRIFRADQRARLAAATWPPCPNCGRPAPPLPVRTRKWCSYCRDSYQPPDALRPAGCGHLVVTRRGRVRPVCADCIPTSCAACGAALQTQARGANPRRWCSVSCSAWALRNPGVARPADWRTEPDWRKLRPCEQCQKDFIPTYRPAKFCSRACVGAHQAAIRAAARPECSAGCGAPAKSGGMCKPCYRRANRHKWHKDPDRERARLRIKTHRRKDWSRLTDVTPEYEMGLRAKAKRCPLCKVKLTDQPYLPNSKELDHIVPQGAGGTHTIGNVRIICRQCNITRPNDGSDYTGPVTLWAEVA